MSKLSKWLPFKFKRNKRQKQEEPELRSVPVQPAPAMHPMFESVLSDRLWRSPLTVFDDMERFFGDFTPRVYQPSVDIIDEGGHIRVTAELAGIDRDDIEITVQDGLLILRGEKHGKNEIEEEGCYRVERYFGHFQRAIPLPLDVDTDGAEAKLERGLLTIRLPKTSDAGAGRRISIA